MHRDSGLDVLVGGEAAADNGVLSHRPKHVKNQGLDGTFFGLLV